MAAAVTQIYTRDQMAWHYADAMHQRHFSNWYRFTVAQDAITEENGVRAVRNLSALLILATSLAMPLFQDVQLSPRIFSIYTVESK